MTSSPADRAAWLALGVTAGSFVHPLGLALLAVALVPWDDLRSARRWARAAAVGAAAAMPVVLVAVTLEQAVKHTPLWQVAPLLAPLLAIPLLGGPHRDAAAARRLRRRITLVLAPVPVLLALLTGAMAVAGFFDTDGPTGPASDAAVLYTAVMHLLLAAASAVHAGTVGLLLGLLAPRPEPALADALEIALRHASVRCERLLSEQPRWTAVVGGVPVEVALDEWGAPAHLSVTVALPVGPTCTTPPPGLMRALPGSTWPEGLSVDLVPDVMAAAGPRPGSLLRDGHLTLVCPLEGGATRLRQRTSEERIRATHRLTEMLRDATAVVRAGRLALAPPTR